MADIITKESADAANSNVKQRIDEFRKTIDYLLSAFEKTLIPAMQCLRWTSRLRRSQR